MIHIHKYLHTLSALLIYYILAAYIALNSKATTWYIFLTERVCKKILRGPSHFCCQISLLYILHKWCSDLDVNVLGYFIFGFFCYKTAWLNIHWARSTRLVVPGPPSALNGVLWSIKPVHKNANFIHELNTRDFPSNASSHSHDDTIRDFRSMKEGSYITGPSVIIF